MCQIVTLIFSFFYMPEQYSIVWIYQVFFIHSLVGGHLDYFHHLSIINNAAMTLIYTFLHEHMLSFFSPLGMCLGVKLLQMASPCLIFWETARLFFTVAVPLLLIPSNVWGFCFSASLSALVRSMFLTIIVLLILFWFWFEFLSDVEHLFPCISQPFVIILFGKMHIQIFYTFFSVLGIWSQCFGYARRALYHCYIPGSTCPFSYNWVICLYTVKF